MKIQSVEKRCTWNLSTTTYTYTYMCMYMYFQRMWYAANTHKLLIVGYSTIHSRLVYTCLVMHEVFSAVFDGTSKVLVRFITHGNIEHWWTMACSIEEKPKWSYNKHFPILHFHLTIQLQTLPVTIVFILYLRIPCSMTVCENRQLATFLWQPWSILLQVLTRSTYIVPLHLHVWYSLWENWFTDTHAHAHISGLLFPYCFTTQVLCKDKEMCTSPALLRFLGFDPHADKMYFKRRREYLQRLEEATTEKVSAQ